MMDHMLKLDSLGVSCKICGAMSPPFDETTVLRKYRVQYFCCARCGFIQTEKPYWLEEAYSAAIAAQDVGIMLRNLVNAELTSAVLNLLFPDVSCAVDFGAGHGVFVRLMRDRGFNFHWSDLHATNDYARGFERTDDATYDFLTSFEVLEHLNDPVLDLEELMKLSGNILVSTCVVPRPAPKLSDWWYYSQTSGQHIAFYTQDALQLLAKRFNRNLLSAGPYHLFSKEPKSEFLFRIATRLRIAKVVNRFYQHRSLIEDDYKQMVR